MTNEEEFQYRLDPESCPNCRGNGNAPIILEGVRVDSYYCDCPMGLVKRQRDNRLRKMLHDYGPRKES